MNHRELSVILQQYQFEKYAEIKSNGSHAYFQPESTVEEKKGNVYLWVEELNATFEVVYVGKAGKRMKDRCSQHFGGFKGGSIAGKRNSSRIVKGISEKKIYHVFSRQSEKATVLGEGNISLEAVEELAFIQKFNPPWNTLK